MGSFRSSVVERAFRKRKVPCSIHGGSKYVLHSRRYTFADERILSHMMCPTQAYSCVLLRMSVLPQSMQRKATHQHHISTLNTCTAGEDRDGGVLMLLATMLEAAHAFVQRAAQLAAREGASSPVGLPAAVYPPFQPQLDRLTPVSQSQLPCEPSNKCNSL